MVRKPEKTGANTTFCLAFSGIWSTSVFCPIIIMFALGIISFSGSSAYCSLDTAGVREQPTSPAPVIAFPKSSIDANLPPEEQTASLRKEELDLAKFLLKEFPENADVLVLMGNVLGRHGDSETAIKYWEKAARLNPDRPDIYCSLGKITLGRGEYEQAIEYFQKAMQINPAVRGGPDGIARALMALGKQDQAIEELEKGLSFWPGNASGHELLAQLYLQRKEYEKARDHYEAAVKVLPSFTNAYYGLMSAYSRLKEPEKAKENMAIFKRLKNEDMKILKDRNEAYDDLLLAKAAVAQTYAEAEAFYEIHGDYNRAHQLLIRGLAIDPNNIRCLESIGLLYLTTGHLMNAMQAYTKVTEISPNSLLCYLNIGMICSRLGRPDDSEAAFKKAIALAPLFSDPHRELAKLYLRIRKDLPGALELAQKAVDLEEKAENYFVLAWACDLNGDMTRALEALEKAIQLDPNNMRYKQAYEQAKKRN